LKHARNAAGRKNRRVTAMPWAKMKGQKNRKWWFANRECIGYRCFSPGTYQHRGAIGAAGSKSSGTSLMCVRNGHHGCPSNPPYDPVVAKENRKKGWRIA
jgi:hypothetical protein